LLQLQYIQKNYHYRNMSNPKAYCHAAHKKIIVLILILAAFVVDAADMMDWDLLPLDKAFYDMDILKEQITEIDEDT